MLEWLLALPELIINGLDTLILHMPCIFRQLTGLYCPGCGGTRAVKYLLTGHPVTSIRYHPLVVYGLAVVVLELISAGIARWTKNPKWYLGRHTFFVYVAVGIIAVNWVYKNYMLVVRGIDLLSAAL